MPDSETYTDRPNDVRDLDPELNSRLDQMRDAGMAITKQWKEMWLLAFKYVWGRQLQNIKPKDDWNYIIVNRIYPLMFSTISKLAKNNPKVLTFPWDKDKEGVTEFAEMWAGILQYLWESPYELSMRTKLIYGLLDSAVYGYMVGKVYWDSRIDWDEEKGEYTGNVRHSFINPATFWTDPVAETIEGADSCGTFRRAKMEWAQRRWPKFKKEIAAQAYTADDPQYFEGSEIIYESQKASTPTKYPSMMFNKIVDLILRRGMYEQENTLEADNEQKYVTIEEIYWKDDSTEHIKIEDPVDPEILRQQGVITTEPTTGKHIDLKTGQEYAESWPMVTAKEYDKPKFPKGRFVLRIGKTILNPGEEEQKYRYSRWPFSVMPYHILPHMWQGGNAVEMSRNNNDVLNLTVSALVHRTRLSADPERIMEANALARDRKGQVRQVKPRGLGKFIIVAKGAIDKIKNMDYGQMDPSTIILSQVLKQDIDDSMFSQDAARGAGSNKTPLQKGSGKMTATEAAKVDINSHDYTAMQSIFLDSWIDDTLTLIAELTHFNYSEGRKVKIIGNDQERGRAEVSSQMLDVRFDVNIVPGSTMPFDKERKKENYIIAHKVTSNPMFQPMLEELLQVLEISNRKKILLKHQGSILFMQFIQMAQMLQQVDPKEIQQALMLIPELKPLYDLLMQAGQLAMAMPQAKGAA